MQLQGSAYANKESAWWITTVDVFEAMQRKLHSVIRCGAVIVTDRPVATEPDDALAPRPTSAAASPRRANVGLGREDQSAAIERP